MVLLHAPLVSAARQVWGLFRIHQFEKIEQFVYCKPEESKEIHEEMITISEKFFQSLEIPYRVIAIVLVAVFFLGAGGLVKIHC